MASRVRECVRVWLSTRTELRAHVVYIASTRMFIKDIARIW